MITIGSVIHVTDADYLYGTGPMRLRITQIGATQRFPDGEWLDLEGLQLRPDGSQLSSRPRHVLVRASAVRNQDQAKA